MRPEINFGRKLLHKNPIMGIPPDDPNIKTGHMGGIETNEPRIGIGDRMGGVFGWVPKNCYAVTEPCEALRYIDDRFFRAGDARSDALWVPRR